MSYSEARNHFETARMNTADAVTIEMLDGLKHLAHSIEEDFRTQPRSVAPPCPLGISNAAGGSCSASTVIFGVHAAGLRPASLSRRASRALRSRLSRT